MENKNHIKELNHLENLTLEEFGDSVVPHYTKRANIFSLDKYI